MFKIILKVLDQGNWVNFTVGIVKVVAPKRAALAEANTRLQGANQKLSTIRTKVAELRAKVANLEENLMKASCDWPVHLQPMFVQWDTYWKFTFDSES